MFSTTKTMPRSLNPQAAQDYKTYLAEPLSFLPGFSVKTSMFSSMETAISDTLMTEIVSNALEAGYIVTYRSGIKQPEIRLDWAEQIHGKQMPTGPKDDSKPFLVPRHLQGHADEPRSGRDRVWPEVHGHQAGQARRRSDQGLRCPQHRSCGTPPGNPPGTRRAGPR